MLEEDRMESLAKLACRLLGEPEEPGEYGGGPMFALVCRLAVLGMSDLEIEIRLMDVINQLLQYID